MGFKPATHDLKRQIKMYVKNRLDISDLIKDIDLRDLDLSRAIITTLVRIGEDISGCNFTNAQIGGKDKIVQFLNCNISNCNFEGTQFLGFSMIRSCLARNCNFKNADVALVDYQHTDFRGSSFCNSKITIGTRSGIGCIFPKEMFEELCKGWNMRIKVEEGK